MWKRTMPSWILRVWVIMLLWSEVRGQAELPPRLGGHIGPDHGANIDHQSCYDQFGRAQKCIPDFVNAAYNMPVEATNTCGVTKATLFCHQTEASGQSKTCEMCDNKHPHTAHPVSYLTDFNNQENFTWWQSETILEGIQYPNVVNITLNLRRPYDITYIRVLFQSMQPESWAIYKKTTEDGPWIPYQYYSATCFPTYRTNPEAFLTKEDETRALCDKEFTDLTPLSGGTAAFSTLDHRPSAYQFESSPVLQEWVTASAIRIVLTRLNTFGDEIFGDKQVLRSYYYAIADLAIGGRCKCNGHAKSCDPSPHDPSFRMCRCEHNTMGLMCEQCLPSYNDQPWAPATSTNAHECQKCNCNGRSHKCRFDRDLFERTGHGGHCIECMDNTDGPNCERCKPEFYQRQDGRCVPCNCNQIGSMFLQCDEKGQCPCRPGVEGQRCDRCASNHFEFSDQGCKSCNCDMGGSIHNPPSCDPVNGTCHCKNNVEGQQCDKCRPGFFNLLQTNQFGCTPCFCYGHSAVCSTAPGYSKYNIQSTFFRDRERWRAVEYSGKEISTRHEPHGQNLAVAAPGRDPVYFVAPDRYLGDQRASYNQNLTFVLRIGEEGPRPTSEDIIIESNDMYMSIPIFGQRNPLPSIRNQEYRFQLHEDPSFEWMPRLNHHDLIKILSNVTAIKIKATYVPRGTGFIDNVHLQSAQRASIGAPATWIEMCTCPLGYVGQFCESCAPGFRRDPPGGGLFARCVPCNCNGHAEICDTETGQCICQHNTAGEFCERCAPRFYGNALIGNPDDCRPCPCPDQGACAVLPDETVACLECPAGYTGRRCELCFDGYFGDPQGLLGEGEKPCERCMCNENVDPNAVSNCNTTTGECLKCIHRTAGEHCELCLPGHFGNPLSDNKGDCKPCDCHPTGTIPEGDSNVGACDEQSGQCRCQPNVVGRRCDRCKEGYYNLQSGEGCTSCNCDPIGAFNKTCDVTTGQCYCRVGVMGKQCDQCIAYHYGLSPDGCSACDCDPVGAESLQCDPDGQCKCRNNVEGRRCQRCKENTYNKQQGCLDCPACYNLVQDAVNSHRAKLKELKDLLLEIERNPQMTRNLDFEEKLRDVHAIVQRLWTDAQSASGTDSRLVAELNDLMQQIVAVQKAINQINEQMDLAGTIIERGERNMTAADETLKRAAQAYKQAKEYLENEGRDALNKARERSDRLGEQSNRMGQISKEARTLADRHQQDAEEVYKVAEEALGASREAEKIAQDARSTQAKTENEIRLLSERVKSTLNLMSSTRSMANEALTEAKKAYDAALGLYTQVKSTEMPDADVEKMKEQAHIVTTDAKRIAKEAEDLLNKHRELLGVVSRQRVEAERLLREAERQQQTTDDLLVETEKAKSTAEEAVSTGESVLSEAKRTLETLKGFDSNVKESKEKAKQELKRVGDIEKMISDAERKTSDAKSALKGADRDAQAARDIAREAERIAKQASKDAENVRAEAGKTKEQASHLQTESSRLAVKVGTTDQRLKEFEQQAANDGKLASDAMDKTGRAKTNATDTSQKIREALTTIQTIMNKLNSVSVVDGSLLEELERRLAAAEKELADARLDERIAELQKAREQQAKWMRDYDEEIRKLTADVDNVQAIRDSLPDACFRRVKLEPEP